MVDKTIFSNKMPMVRAEQGGRVTWHCQNSSQVKPSHAKSRQAKPNQVKPSQAKPSQVKSSQVKPSQAKSNYEIRCYQKSYINFILLN